MIACLALVAIITALVVVAIAWDREKGASLLRQPGASPGIDAQATLNPRIVFFGDRMQALFDVTLDRTRVDPDSVRVAAELAPWEILGTRRERRDAGTTTHLRWTYELGCLIGPCVPAGATAPLEFAPARVTYAAPGEASGARSSLDIQIPLLVVYSRFSAAGFESTDDAASPWRIDVLTLPAVSYLVSPSVVMVLLLAGSLGLLGAAGGFVYLAWPRRAPAPAPEPSQSPKRPSLTPLEQALALLEETVRLDGAGDQRRALELVAEELDEWGDVELAGAARVLAWSVGAPRVEQTTALAARVRAELEQALIESAASATNGAGRADSTGSRAWLAPPPGALSATMPARFRGPRDARSSCGSCSPVPLSPSS